jgi:hypothetical protein
MGADVKQIMDRAAGGSSGCEYHRGDCRQIRRFRSVGM